MNSIANYIRYPDAITLFFIKFVLMLFDEFSNKTHSLAIQEQITRILIERKIVEQPYPWGLSYTIMQLIKNPIYNFKAKPYFKPQ